MEKWSNLTFHRIKKGCPEKKIHRFTSIDVTELSKSLRFLYFGGVNRPNFGQKKRPTAGETVGLQASRFASGALLLLRGTLRLALGLRLSAFLRLLAGRACPVLPVPVISHGQPFPGASESNGAPIVYSYRFPRRRRQRTKMPRFRSLRMVAASPVSIVSIP